MEIKVYHKDAKIFIELPVQTAEELRHELAELPILAKGFENTVELYNKLYYQTQN